VSELYDVPEDMSAETVYVAGTPERMKWAVFVCPCDFGHDITVSLQEEDHPHWRLRVDRGRPTIYPSIDVLDGRRCHYWIIRGRVQWAPSAPRA
jgi:hypothetical protein